MNQRIVCDFVLNLDGSRALKYALWFAGAMRRELCVHMPDGEDQTALTRAFFERYGVDLVRPGVRFLNRRTSMSERESGSTCIYVTSLPLNEARRLAPARSHLLLSLQEDGERQGQRVRPICLPFGSRDMEMRAADLAFPIAKQLGTHVVAVHTTYRKPGIASNLPAAHLVEGTRATMCELESRAHGVGVPIVFDIRMAEEIARYVIKTAIEKSCGLLVMSCGRVLHGSNAERVAERTHLPMLLVGGAS